MFYEPERNVIQSDEGFSVEVLGRRAVRYEDSEGALIVNAELLLGEPSIRLLLCARVRNLATGTDESLPMERRRRVGENIGRAIASTGHEADVVYERP